MSTVSFEKDVALDLLNSKLRVIKQEIEKLLLKWDQDSAKEFVEKTRNGEIPEAEHDAIIMTNLLQAMDTYEKMLIEIV